MMLAEKKKKNHRASKASQALALPTTKLASIARCYFSYFTLFFVAFFPPLRSLVPGYQLLYTVQSPLKLSTKLMTLLPIYFNLLSTC